MVGTNHWKSCSAEKKPKEWMTLWEEAFGFFMIENYQDQVEDWVDFNKRVSSKYGVNGNAKRNQGYTVPGIQRWAELLKDVRERRETEKSKHDAARFSTRYLKEKQKERDARTRRGTKRKKDNVAVREAKYNKALKSGDKALFDGLAYMNIVTAPAVNEEATAPAVNEVTATAV